MTTGGHKSEPITADQALVSSAAVHARAVACTEGAFCVMLTQHALSGALLFQNVEQYA